MAITKLVAKNSLITFKLETTSGVEAAPNPATDAVLIAGDPNLSFNLDQIDTNESTGTLDSFAPLVGGMSITVGFDVILKGSGTAGVPPEIGKVLQACGLAEVITAAAFPAAAEACAAGGSTTKVMLGTSALATLDIYNGMPLKLTGNVAADTFIADYDASKGALTTDTLPGAPVATSQYQIQPNVLYKPISTGIPSGTLYLYTSGVLWKFAGCRGTFSRSSETGKVGRYKVTLQGIFIGKSDVAAPQATFNNLRAPVFLSGKALVDRAPVQYRTLNIDLGNQITQAPNPADANGRDVADIVDRKTVGSFDPLSTLVANGNVIADMQSGTQKIIHERFGQVPGNRVALTIPAAQYTNAPPVNDNGYWKDNISFAATGPNNGFFLTFF